MNNISCKNVYLTEDENKRIENFNTIWIDIINLILKH